LVALGRVGNNATELAPTPSVASPATALRAVSFNVVVGRRCCYRSRANQRNDDNGVGRCGPNWDERKWGRDFEWWCYDNDGTRRRSRRWCDSVGGNYDCDWRVGCVWRDDDGKRRSGVGRGTFWRYGIRGHCFGHDATDGDIRFTT